MSGTDKLKGLGLKYLRTVKHQHLPSADIDSWLEEATPDRVAHTDDSPFVLFQFEGTVFIDVAGEKGLIRVDTDFDSAMRALALQECGIVRRYVRPLNPETMY